MPFPFPSEYENPYYSKLHEWAHAEHDEYGRHRNRISAYSFGVRETNSGATNATNWPALMAATARVGGTGPYPPVVVEFGPGTYTFDNATLNIPVGVSLFGQTGMSGASRMGTQLNGLSLTIGDEANDWAHGTQLRNFSIGQCPGIGIEWISNPSEQSVMDFIFVDSAAGAGIKLTGAGTPMYFGVIGLHNNNGPGLHLVALRNAAKIDHLSGDFNMGGFIVIENATTGDAAPSLRIDTIKYEHNPFLLDIVNSPDAIVSIGDVSVNDSTFGTGVATALTPGLNPLICQRDGARPAQIEVDRVRMSVASRAGNYTHGYHDVITGQTIAVHDLHFAGLSTRQRRTIHPVYGSVGQVSPVLTGTVGTSQTSWAHGLGYTPVIESIDGVGNVAVWQSAAPDSQNIYLTASSSTQATVKLGRANRVGAFDTILASDNFTGADGTAIAGRTPDNGGTAWSTAGTWTIQGNMALSAGNDSLFKTTGTTDHWASATINTGTAGSTRAVGIMLRRVDASNYWSIGLNSSYGVGIQKVTGGVFSAVLHQVNTPIAADTNYILAAEIRGNWIRVMLNNVLIMEYLTDGSYAAATTAGIRVTSRGLGTNPLRIDALTVRSSAATSFSPTVSAGGGAITTANARKSADQTTTLATATDVTDLSFTIPANETWSFEFHTQIGCDNTGGVKFAITTPGTLRAVVDGNGNTTASRQSSVITTSGTLTGQVYNNVLGANGFANIRGTVVNGGPAGTVQLQFASGTAGQTSTVYLGASYVTARKVA